MQPLSELFYRRDTVTMARALLGTVLCRRTGAGLAAGLIVETESYLSKDDPACHAARGKTRRNAPMFGPPGTAYIYFIYGNHFCFNVVTGPPGSGEAVLVRALEPLEGLSLMRRRRGGRRGTVDLVNGPGKLCQALAIDGSLNEHDLRRPPLWIAAPAVEKQFSIVRTTRVGISRGSEMPLRFYVAGNQYVSRRSKDETGGPGT